MKGYCTTGAKQSQCDLICFACRCVATRRDGGSGAALAAVARRTAAELRFKGRWIFLPTCYATSWTPLVGDGGGGGAVLSGSRLTAQN